MKTLTPAPRLRAFVAATLLGLFASPCRARAVRALGATWAPRS